MTLYAIFDAKPGRYLLPEAVPERFSALAAILPPVFLLRHGLWLELLAWLAFVVALGFAPPYIGTDLPFWLYLLCAVWLGLAAPSLRRGSLRRRGWRHRGDLAAPSTDLARLEAMR